MIRASTIFIAFATVVIAGSLGVGLYYLLALSIAESALVAVAALTFLVLYNVVAMRLRDRPDVGNQIAGLARGTGDLARQVSDFGRRLAAMEHRLGNSESTIRAGINPLAGEIAELGTLVKQLAISVATHDELLAERSAGATVPAAAPRETAPVEPAPAVIPTNGKGAQAAADLAAEQQTIATVKGAIDANRIDLYLQPLVTLPQRKVRFYEAVSRLRDDKGEVLTAAAFIAPAEKAGLMARIDHMVLFRCVQVLRRLQTKSNDIGLFCNLAGATLSDEEIFPQCFDFLEANRVLASSLVLEFKQSKMRNLGPTESERLANLADIGYRFSIDHVADLRIEPRELADRGVRFIKVPADLLLDQNRAANSDIHPADLSDLLGRFGIDLVAERIEGESAVVDLLDYDVRYGQGFLFAPPRPLRQDGAPRAQAPPPAAMAGAIAAVAEPR